MEGLRTLEETGRFALNDAEFSAPIKRLRHELAAAVATLSREQLLRARDTGGDVGANLQTEGEYSRSSTRNVIQAAAGRVQQSLRCLEEYGKIISVDFARQVEVIRYRSYDACAKLELCCGGNDERQQRLAQASLYVLSDGAANEATYKERLIQCAEGGVDVFQLRDRRLSDREQLQRARLTMEVLAGYDMLFIVNDRTDIAIAAGADGVHVGQDELTVEAVRRSAGSGLLVGVSTHDLDQARRAVVDGADYIGVGPCFPSQTKSFAAFVPLKLLGEVASEITIPAFAIGGITAENVEQVQATGLRRVAVSAAVCAASDVRSAATSMKLLLSRR